MFKKFRSKELELSHNGHSEIERMLALMPRYCTCSACTKLKEEAKVKLGKSKYATILRSVSTAQ